MAYQVLDKNGIAYVDSTGRRVIKCGEIIQDTMIEKGFFTKGGIDNMLNNKRIADMVSKKSDTMESPSNKMADISGKKAKKK